MTPDNDPDFDSDPVATRYAAMGSGQEPEPGKSVNRNMKDAHFLLIYSSDIYSIHFWMPKHSSATRPVPRNVTTK